MELNKNDDILLYSSSFVSNNHGIPRSPIDCSFSKKELDSSTPIRENHGEFGVNKDNDLIIEIYRFKFTDVFMYQLYDFSKIHQLDNRKDFKEAWNQWIKDNNSFIQEEISRLRELGFKGDIIDKMFKSARYYFRKRDNIKDGIKVEIKQANRKYQCASKLLLETMDLHIKNLLCTKDSVKKPSIAFLDFCKENKDLLKEEIQYLLKLGFSEIKEIQIKIKKTYKNKYFSFIHK